MLRNKRINVNHKSRKKTKIFRRNPHPFLLSTLASISG